MNKWLKSALELQKIDLHIRDLQLRSSLIPIEIQHLNAESAQSKNDFLAQKEDLYKKENMLKSLETEIIQKEGIVVKLLAHAASIRKQDEYQKNLAEIESQKQQKSILEDQAIELMDQISIAQTQVVSSEKTLKEKQSEINDEIKELEQTLEKVVQMVAKEKEAREKIRPSLPPDILSNYERLINRGKGTPVAAVIDQICQNCNMKVTAQTMNDLEKDDPVYCGNCSHFLYNPKTLDL